MPFADALLEALKRDLPSLLPVVWIWVVATLMLWPGDLLLSGSRIRWWAPLTLAVLAVAAWLVLRAPAGHGFSGMFVVDGATRGFQLLCLAASAIVVLLSGPSHGAVREARAEYHALILFSTSGMLVLVGATDLMSVFFSLELMVVCIYILAAYLKHQERSLEAGLKYFLMGAFASGVLLYGFSLLYAAAGGGATRLDELARALGAAAPAQRWLVDLGMLMVLVGFSFKLAAAPFHQWSPDAYDGAPTPVTAFMAMAPKVALMAALFRVLPAAQTSRWELQVALVAGASMVLGNVAALRQQGLKRMLAYSSIAHVGYMMLGLLSRDVPGGLQAVWVYLLTYIPALGGAFAVLSHLQGEGVGERIDDFRGLARTRPALAFAMMVCLLSLTGIPPILGFFGKFVVFKVAIQQGHVALTVLALLTSALAAYYYLGVVAAMYFAAPGAREPGAREPGPQERQPLGAPLAWLAGLSAAFLLLGTLAGPKLMAWAGTILRAGQG